MSFFIEVETPAPPLLSVRTKNTKPPAPKTTLLGLFEFSSSISYPNFIRIVAQACRTQTENLVHSSMQWKFDRPNNAKRRPLTNAVGLGIAIKTLKERKKDYAFTLFMAPPSPIKAELPWLTNSNEDDPAGPLDFGFSIDELTAPGNSTLSLREQIAGIDNASNPHFNRLLEKYAIGNHPQFPANASIVMKPDFSS
ncbi:hypothetical protein B0H13DRAFT_1854808 [Mycena leptocephala]|nr:hypothetical protein B0H13DRAFT_1854808 [Mycena leptocephala]